MRRDEGIEGSVKGKGEGRGLEEPKAIWGRVDEMVTSAGKEKEIYFLLYDARTWELYFLRQT